MTPDQKHQCRKSFEAQADQDGEAAQLDETGHYKNILHRAQWRRWVSAWEACIGCCVSTPHQPHPLGETHRRIETGGFSHLVNDEAAVKDKRMEPGSDLYLFLRACKVSGIFFDGQDAVGNDGVYFVSRDVLQNFTS